MSNANTIEALREFAQNSAPSFVEAAARLTSNAPAIVAVAVAKEVALDPQLQEIVASLSNSGVTQNLNEGGLATTANNSPEVDGRMV